MLAQNFKTAADLGIKDFEHSALLRVLGMLERGEIKPHAFDMDRWNFRTECGTVHCIGGWAEAISERRVRRKLFRNMTDEMADLFFPGNPHEPIMQAYSATTAQAAMALRNYLTIGEPCWREVMEVG